MGQCTSSRARILGPKEDDYVCVKTLRHRSSVSGLCTLPNGRLVSATEDSIQLWTLEPVLVYKEIEALGCVSLCPLPGEKSQLAATTHSEIKILDIETAKVTRSIEERAVSLCPVSENILAAGVEKEHRGLIQILDLRSDSDIKSLRGHTEAVRALTMVPKNNYLVSGSHDQTIKIWDLKGTDAVRTMKGHSEPVVALTFLSDNQLVSGSFDSTMKLWDPWSGNQVGQLKGHTESVNSLCVTTTQRLVSGSDDRTIRVWNIINRNAVLLTGHESFVHAVCAVEEDRIASASNDRTVKIWAPRSQAEKEVKQDTSLVVSETKTTTDDVPVVVEAEDSRIYRRSGGEASPSVVASSKHYEGEETQRSETPPPVMQF